MRYHPSRCVGGPHCLRLTGGEPTGESMPLYPDILGDFVRPVSTSSEKAQAYFDQGMRLRYAFATSDAARPGRIMPG